MSLAKTGCALAVGPVNAVCRQHPGRTSVNSPEGFRHRSRAWLARPMVRPEALFGRGQRLKPGRLVPTGRPAIGPPTPGCLRMAVAWQE
jgi:hypothetical protein